MSTRRASDFDLSQFHVEPGPVTVFEAVFRAKPGDLAVAKIQFSERFGQEVFDLYIAHYYSNETPGFLFFAPTTIYRIWFMDRLARNLSERTKRIYAIPPEFIAVENFEGQMFENCAKCGALMDAGKGEDGTKFGEPGDICYPCYAKLMTHFIEYALIFRHNKPCE